MTHGAEEQTGVRRCISRNINGLADGRRGCEGLNGFDFAHRIKGSVPVQAKTTVSVVANQLSADSNQRDYALAA
jgi:hypothetical protein